MPDGRFPPPWTVEEYRGISYIVSDANRFAVAHIYFASDPSHTRYLMTKDEARIIAATIARVPEMVMRAKTDDDDHPATGALCGSSRLSGAPLRERRLAHSEKDEAGGATPGFPA
jgi:hypothetical protein